MAEQYPGASIPMPLPTGTVQPVQPFDAETAAAALYKAMKGFGTDEDAVIKVLGSHCNAQRIEIESKFKQMKGKDLRDELKSELSGKFEDVVIGLFDPPRVYDARQCYESIKGLGTDENALIEVLVPKTNSEIKEIKAQYKRMYKKDLEQDIQGDTGGYFKRLLTAIVTGNREDRPQADPALARQEAEELQAAGEGRLGTDEGAFMKVLCLRSIAQLRETFMIYRAITGKEIEQAIKSEMSGTLEDGTLAIVKAAKNTPAYFAERLYKSMKGMGTDDKALIRSVVSRCEVDMKLIKEEFYRMYSSYLTDFIKGDCSGDYKKILLVLIGSG